MAFTTKYVKEDLPTYSEMIHEFWEKGLWESRCLDDGHDPKWQEKDPYWEIPRFKVILATACNQFNKFLYVDHILYVEDLYKVFSRENGLSLDMTDVLSVTNPPFCEGQGGWISTVYTGNMGLWRPHFTISREGIFQDPIPVSSKLNSLMDEDHIPPIYELSLPTGLENSFIVKNDNVTRFKVNDLQGLIELRFVWNSTNGYYTHLGKPIDMVWDCTHPRFKELLQICMAPIKSAMEM